MVKDNIYTVKDKASVMESDQGNYIMTSKVSCTTPPSATPTMTTSTPASGASSVLIDVVVPVVVLIVLGIALVIWNMCKVNTNSNDVLRVIRAISLKY